MESIPLQLIIIVLILALTIPLIMRYWWLGDSAQVEANIRGQLDYFCITAKQVLDNGVGNSDIVKLNFKDGTFTKVEYVIIGGDLKDDTSSIIKWKTSTSSENLDNVPGDVRIGFYDETTKDYRAYQLGSGAHTIYLECKEFEGNKDTNSMLFIELKEVR